MSTRLRSLGDDDLRAEVERHTSLIEIGHLDDQSDTGLKPWFGEPARIAKREHHRVWPAPEGELDHLGRH